MTDDDAWSEPKRFGYGAGLPIRWQGWALLGGYVAAMALLAALLLPQRRPLCIALVLVATVLLIVLSAQHTRGGWRWRWGGD